MQSFFKADDEKKRMDGRMALPFTCSKNNPLRISNHLAHQRRLGYCKQTQQWPTRDSDTLWLNSVTQQ